MYEKTVVRAQHLLMLIGLIFNTIGRAMWLFQLHNEQNIHTSFKKCEENNYGFYLHLSSISH